MNEPTPRLAELHQLCNQDYAKGQAQRAAAGHPQPTTTAPLLPPMTGELDAAISIAQKVLAAYGTVEGGISAYAQAHGGITEALRILLRALNAEPLTEEEAARRSVDRAFPAVAAFLAAERGDDQ